MRILFFLLISFSTYGTNYVVIGAFNIEQNAVTLAQKAKGEVYHNVPKQLYYVFVMKTEDHEEALAEAKRLQSETEYKDAWVFLDKEPVITEVPQEVVISAPEIPKPDSNSKRFLFNVLYESGSPASGAEITVIEPKSQRKEYVAKGNDNITIKRINQTGDMRIECDLAGYRKIVQNVNFNEPTATDGVTVQGGQVTVPFHLVRLKKGDKEILYNVFFYKDAAIMRPESKFDLDGLQAMMNENPKYKIRIHGHSNGNASGKIMEVGSSGDFFSINSAREGGGSAKKLSAKRADAIRNYLAAQGIDPNRMDTKAWGGKKPIYDKHHTQASANVRVEVEVIEE